MCEICGKACKNQNMLRSHLQTYFMFECPICNKMISKQTYQRHMRLHSSGSLFKCTLCEYSDKTKGEVGRHIKRVHNHKSIPIVKEFKCDICSKPFAGRFNLNRHEKICHTGKRSARKTSASEIPVLPSYDGEMSSEEALQDSSEFQEQEETLQVQEQEKTLQQQQIVQRIRKNNKATRSSKQARSEVSKLKFKSAEAAKSAATFMCQVCARIFATNQKLRRHIQDVHQKDMNLSCDMCSKKFYNKSTLQLHIETIHVNSESCQQFKCDFENCVKTLRNLANLRNHQKSHSDERPYSCATCQKSFRSLPNLYMHQKCHSSKRPHTCSTCLRSFKISHHLVHHQKTCHA